MGRNGSKKWEMGLNETDNDPNDTEFERVFVYCFYYELNNNKTE